MKGWARRKITYSIATQGAGGGKEKKNRGVGLHGEKTGLFSIDDLEGNNHHILVKPNGDRVRLSKEDTKDYRRTNSVAFSSMDTVHFYAE